MARTLPTITRRQLEQAAAEDGLIFFVSISHPEITGTIRLVTDAVDYDFEGETWHRAGFDLALLSDGDGPPQSQFKFDNVDRRATAMLLNLNGRLRVDFRVISTGWFNGRSNPRTVKPGLTPTAVYEAKYCELTQVQMTPAEVTGRLQLLDIRLETWPARRVTKAQFPGVFLS